jgi:isochorismatase family protein
MRETARARLQELPARGAAGAVARRGRSARRLLNEDVARDDLHGNVPDESPAALLLIDFIDDLEFPGGERLLPGALAAARRAKALKAACRASRIPAVYVDDNFGGWRSDFRGQVRHCREDGVRGASLVELLAPDDDDYFVLKP